MWDESGAETPGPAELQRLSPRRHNSVGRLSWITNSTKKLAEENNLTLVFKKEITVDIHKSTWNINESISVTDSTKECVGLGLISSDCIFPLRFKWTFSGCNGLVEKLLSFFTASDCSNMFRILLWLQRTHFCTDFCLHSSAWRKPLYDLNRYYSWNPQRAAILRVYIRGTMGNPKRFRKKTFPKGALLKTVYQRHVVIQMEALEIACSVI